jgi:hypothetical protein
MGVRKMSAKKKPGDEFYGPPDVKKSWDEEAKQPNIDPHSITEPFDQGKSSKPPIRASEAQVLPQEHHGDLLASILAGLAHVGARVKQ